MNTDTRNALIGALPHGSKFLFVLNAKASATGAPIFAGIDRAEKLRRRAAGKRQRAARRINRAA
ncbi:hypothetical protein JOF56_003707 [Kibdelosporangium banguiense]|uniref:Uncharacterized protein n=1 Tax=Kibdelosporangium banguiense TaxID=1365924 RepID=A0ABS4TFX9_9PSEU|nr:hypothetical protein [Kibdelosporangium banguiense]MBP2323322.1 hypothetical protein [Kibdelosporangium banguiense]